MILKFSEVYFQSPDEKIFDVKVGNTKIIENLDIFGSLHSKLLPLDFFFDVVLQANGKVLIDGEDVSNGYRKKNLIIDFMIGQADNPKINAILLVRGGKENTHYRSYMRYQAELDKLRSQSYE